MRRNLCSRPEPWTKHWTIWTICRKRFFHVLPYTILHLYVKTLQTGNWEQRTYQCDRFIRDGDEHEIKVRPSHCFLVPSFEHELVWVSCKQISEPVLSFSDSSARLYIVFERGQLDRKLPWSVLVSAVAPGDVRCFCASSRWFTPL